MTRTTDVTQAPRRLRRLRHVLKRNALPRSTMQSRISAGTFAKQTLIGSSAPWSESEVEAWIKALVDERDHHGQSGGTAGGYRGRC